MCKMAEKTYYENGQMARYWDKYENIVYYKNGILEYKCFYSDGLIDRKIRWYKNGSMKSYSQYDGYSLMRKTTYYCSYDSKVNPEQAEDKNVKGTFKYLKGKLHGEIIHYYINGNIVCRKLQKWTTR